MFYTMSALGSTAGDHDNRVHVRNIIRWLENVRIINFGENTGRFDMKVGVLKLRLCRYYRMMNASEIRHGENGSICERLGSIDVPSGEGMDPQAGSTSSFDSRMVEELHSRSLSYYQSPTKSQSINLNEGEFENHMARILADANSLEERIRPGGGKVLNDLLSEDANYIIGRAKGSQADLQLLKCSAREVDPTFADKLVSEEAREGHRYANTQIEGQAIVGDEFNDGWQVGSVGRSHKYRSTVVGEKGRVIMGNKYGGRSILDGNSTSH
ncbi:hypothetical protein F5Y10DRAFT_234243 [Nemania abortiva]|nr:hypothetical protein F5Y10DRAFT_234243 [Nemania abortiva]